MFPQGYGRLMDPEFRRQLRAYGVLTQDPNAPLQELALPTSPSQTGVAIAPGVDLENPSTVPAGDPAYQPQSWYAPEFIAQLEKDSQNLQSRYPYPPAVGSFGGEGGTTRIDAPASPDQVATAPSVGVTAQKNQFQMGQGVPIGLLAAGLGMLANNTGHYGAAGPAIGKGGLVGLQAYGTERDRIAQQSQLANQNRFRDQQLAVNERLRNEQLEINRTQAGYLSRKLKRDEEMDAQLATITAQLQTETDPLKIKSLTRRLAVLQGKAAEVYKADNEKPGKPIKTIEGAGGDMVKEVYRNPNTNEIMWEGEPYKRGSGVTIQNLPENKAATVTAGETAKSVEAARQKAQDMRAAASEFRAITDILSEYQGGKIDEIKASLGQYIPQEDLKKATTASQLSESIRLRASNAFKMPGSVSNYEAQTYISAVPGMLWYKEGREIMSDYADKLATRKSKLVAFEQRMLLDKGFVDQEAFDNYDKSLGPIFSPQEKEMLKTYKTKKNPYSFETAPKKPDAKSQSTFGGGLMKGQVVDGYKYQGGDPANPASWVKQ